MRIALDSYLGYNHVQYLYLGRHIVGYRVGKFTFFINLPEIMIITVLSYLGKKKFSYF